MLDTPKIILSHNTRNCFKMAARIDLCDLLTPKKVKTKTFYCIFFYSPGQNRYFDVSIDQIRTTLTVDIFSTGVGTLIRFWRWKNEGQNQGRLILSINASNWSSYQDEIPHNLILIILIFQGQFQDQRIQQGQPIDSILKAFLNVIF